MTDTTRQYIIDWFQGHTFTQDPTFHNVRFRPEGPLVHTTPDGTPTQFTWDQAATLLGVAEIGVERKPVTSERSKVTTMRRSG